MIDQDVTDEPQPGIYPIEQKPFDPRRMRELIRFWLALMIVGTIPLVIVGIFIGVLTHQLGVSEAKDLALALLGVMGGLTGAILGFYYAAERAAKDI
jgi:hypothetical protein